MVYSHFRSFQCAIQNEVLDLMLLLSYNKGSQKFQLFLFYFPPFPSLPHLNHTWFVFWFCPYCCMLQLRLTVFTYFITVKHFNLMFYIKCYTNKAWTIIIIFIWYIITSFLLFSRTDMNLLPFSHNSISGVRHWCWLIKPGPKLHKGAPTYLTI